MKRAYLYESSGRWYLRYAHHGQVQTYSLPRSIGQAEYEHLHDLITENGTLSYTSD